MKFVSVRQAKDQFSECLEQSQQSAVVITRHGKPTAVIVGAEGKDLEDVVVINDRAFWKMVRKSRKERTHSLEEVEKQLLSNGKKRQQRIAR